MTKISIRLKMYSRHVVTATLFALSLWICSGIVLAQGLTGQISGSVVDSSGAVVSNATLQLMNTQTGQVRTTTTSSEGRFVFPEILPGTFTLTIEASGFKKLEQANLVVSAAERVSLPALALQVGTVGETVTVTGEQSAVKTESAERSGVITTRQYQELPLKGRDWMSGMRMLPGVVDGNATGRDAPGWSTAGGISINGTRTTAVYLNLDGVNLSDTGQNGTNYLAPNIDAIAEVKVLTNNFQAEYGHSSGGNITTVTKSGSREFHGGAYYFNRNEWFNANEWANNRNPAVTGSTTAVAIPKPKYRFNNPGYFVGGPVLIPYTDFNKNRDKLVFFFSQEFLPRKIGSTVQTVVPTLLERAGDFTLPPLNGAGFTEIVNPITRLSFPTKNVIPSNLIDARGLALLKLLPAPNIATTVCAASKCNRQDDIIDTRPRRDTILRVDYNATSKDQTYVRLIQDFEARKGGTFLGSTVTLPQFKTIYTVRSVGAVGTWIRTINSNMLNELTVGINRASQSVDPFENALDLNNRAKTGLSALPTFYPTSNPLNLIPNVTFGVTSATNLAVEGRFPFFGTNSVWDTSDNFSYNRGNHHLKFGIFWEHTARNAARSTVFNGAYNFSSDTNNPLNNAYGYANALLGTVSSYTEASGHPSGHARYNQFEWYAQDTWKLNSRLTVDAGARFIIVQGSYSAGDKLAAFDPAVYDASKQPKLVTPYLCTAADMIASPALCTLLPGTTFRKIGRDPSTGVLLPAVKIGTFSSVGTPYQGMTVYDQKLLKLPPVQIGPRLGLAWDVFGNGKTAVRAGAGMYFDRFADDHVLQSRELPPLVIAPVANFTTINNLAATPLSLSPVNVQYLNRDFRPPAVYNWSLGIQQNLGFGTMIDIAYVGNQQRHLLVSRNLNAVPYGTNFLASSKDVAGVTLQPNFLRPIQGYGDIIYKDFAANGNYNALQVQVNKRFSKNMTFNVSYTWSKALDYTDAEGSAPTNPYINPRSRNYGPAGFDRRQILIFNYTYNLPNFSKNFGGNMLSKIALDGWEFSGVSTFQTGAPLGISCGVPSITDLTGAAGNGIDSRCVQIGNPKDLSGLTDPHLYWFNPNAFKAPLPSGAAITNCGAGCVNGVGTVSKAPIYGPGLNNWDIAMFKNFQLWSESTRLQFRIEGFNIFNRTQYTGVATAGSFSSAALNPTATPPQNIPPNTNATTNFGQFSAAAPSRRFQIGMKLYF